MMIKDRLKTIFGYRVTFMMVPHGAIRPRQININLSVVVLFALTWASITFWGSYLSARQVDTWRTELNNHVLKLKVNYLMAQLDKSREFLDEVKVVDTQLRELINYEQKSTTVNPAAKQQKAMIANTGAGGPTLNDQFDLSQILQNRGANISWERLFEKSHLLKNEAEVRVKSFNDITQWVEMKKRLFLATPIGWPCKGTLSSHYGSRLSPFDGSYEYHPGIDICNSLGSPVRATADGVVRMASWNSGYGNLVVLQHAFGYSTRFGHNSRILVKVGDRVKRGQVLALMGNTGKAAGVHCHYEVWRGAERKDPIKYLKNDFAGQSALSKLFQIDLKKYKKS